MWPSIYLLACLLGSPHGNPSGDVGSLDPATDRLAAAREAYVEGALDAAHDHLQAALALAPDEPGVRLWLGRVLNDLGHASEALEIVEPAIALLPRSPWLQVERGRAERALTRPDAAERSFRAALEAYPEFGTARLQLVELLVHQGSARAQDALEILQPLIEGRPELIDVVLREAEILALLGREAEGEASLRRASDQPRVRLALCRWLAVRERFEEAWRVGEPLIGEAKDVHARTLLAQVAGRAGQPLVAVELLGAVLLEDPGHVESLAELGEVLKDIQDLSGHIAERRLAALPEDGDAWRELFEAYLRDGRIELVLTRFEQMPPALRTDPELLLQHGQALRRAGRAEDARVVLGPLCAAGSTRACYEVGMLEYAEERYEAAGAAFARGASGALAADAHFNHGICLDRLGLYARAAEEYAAATAERDSFAEAWLQLGHENRLRLGQPERARDAYRHYLDLGGDDPEVRRFLGLKSR